MKPVVGKIQPTARLACTWDWCRISSDPGDLEFAEKSIGVLNKPGGVARFANDVPREELPEGSQKRFGRRPVENQTRRKLEKQRPELRPEARHLA